jgi:hypothetical protein
MSNYARYNESVDKISKAVSPIVLLLAELVNSISSLSVCIMLSNSNNFSTLVTNVVYIINYSFKLIPFLKSKENINFNMYIYRHTYAFHNLTEK